MSQFSRAVREYLQLNYGWCTDDDVIAEVGKFNAAESINVCFTVYLAASEEEKIQVGRTLARQGWENIVMKSVRLPMARLGEYSHSTTVRMVHRLEKHYKPVLPAKSTFEIEQSIRNELDPMENTALMLVVEMGPLYYKDLVEQAVVSLCSKGLVMRTAMKMRQGYVAVTEQGIREYLRINGGAKTLQEGAAYRLAKSELRVASLTSCEQAKAPESNEIVIEAPLEQGDLRELAMFQRVVLGETPATIAVMYNIERTRVTNILRRMGSKIARSIAPEVKGFTSVKALQADKQDWLVRIEKYREQLKIV